MKSSMTIVRFELFEVSQGIMTNVGRMIGNRMKQRLANILMIFIPAINATAAEKDDELKIRRNKVFLRENSLKI